MPVNERFYFGKRHRHRCLIVEHRNVLSKIFSLITTESVFTGGCFSEKNHSHSLVLLLFQEVCLRHFSCLVGRMMCLREFLGTQILSS